MGRLSKALLALIGPAATALTAAALAGPITVTDVITAVVGSVLVAGGVYGVPNSGFVDLSKLTAAQRAELNKFLNLR